MSYVVAIWAQPDGWAPPASLEEAAELLGRVHDLPKAPEPRLRELARVLRARFPAAGNDACFWNEASLAAAGEGPVLRLGIAARARREQLQAFVCVEANRLGLHVVDDQAAEVHLADGRVYGEGERAVCVRALAAYWHGDDPAAAWGPLLDLAEQGNRTALRTLGEMALNGRGVRRDLVAGCALVCAAAGWRLAPDLPRAPERPGPLATRALALREELGKAVTADADRLLARMLGDEGPAASLCAHAREIDRIVDSQVGGDPDAALVVWRALGRRGHPRAAWLAGQVHAHRAATHDDLLQELRWTREAARGGEPLALVHMGRLCDEGLWPQARPEEARGWLRKAIACDEPAAVAPARALLAAIVDRTPRPAPVPDVEALRRRAAAEAGDADAAFALAQAYRDGRVAGAESPDASALALLRLAGSLGHARAQVELGDCLAEGRGQPRDEPGAHRLYELAARQGDPQASWRLARRARLQGDAALALGHARHAAAQAHGGALLELALLARDRGEGAPLVYALALLARRHGAPAAEAEALLQALHDCDRAQVRRLLARHAAEGVEALLPAPGPSPAQAAPAAARGLNPAQFAALALAREQEIARERQAALRGATHALAGSLVAMVVAAACAAAGHAVLAFGVGLAGAVVGAWGAMRSAQVRGEPRGLMLGAGVALFVPLLGAAVAAWSLVQTRAAVDAD